jgi:hypothetical protein
MECVVTSTTLSYLYYLNLTCAYSQHNKLTASIAKISREDYPDREKRIAGRESGMNVLWGAWAKEVRPSSKVNELSILGIYDTIWKGGKSDFPFSETLLAVVAYRSYPVDYRKTFKVTLQMNDLDGSPLFYHDIRVETPLLDELVWYQTYEVKIDIQEPGTYELNILINDDRKQYITLNVIGHRARILNLEEDSYEEKWLEDI